MYMCICLVINYVCITLLLSGGLDAGAAPEVRAGGGAAGHRQGRAVQDPGDHGHGRLPHKTQHRQPPPGTSILTPSTNKSIS